MSGERRVATAIRLPADLSKQLRDEAARRDVSMNYLIVRAVTRYLENAVPVNELLATRPATEMGDESKGRLGHLSRALIRWRLRGRG